MEVILKKDVAKLGKAYEVVKVKDGFARNYLLAKGLALKVSKHNIEQLETDKRTRQAQEEKDKRSFQGLAEKIVGKSFTIPMATNETETLYASVNVRDIIEAMKLEGINLEAENILLSEPIKELGIYEVDIRLKYNIASKIKVWVVKK